MSCSSLAFETLLLAVLLSGCDQRPRESAAAGALPIVPIAVGPIPGPQRAEPQLVNPHANSAVARQEGRTLFMRYNCGGCHGDHGGGGMGPSLRDPTWLYGSSDEHLFGSIAEGRQHGMPSWGTKIPADQIWKLVSYIHSMRTEDEPAPPNESIPPPPKS